MKDYSLMLELSSDFENGALMRSALTEAGLPPLVKKEYLILPGGSSADVGAIVDDMSLKLNSNFLDGLSKGVLQIDQITL